MIRNKYFITAFIALAVSVAGIVIRNHSGERYFSCTGQQNKIKEFDGQRMVLSSYVTLTLEAGGKGKVQFQGYLYKDQKSAKLDRIVDFTFSPLKNKTFYLFETTRTTKSPDDTAIDQNFEKISDIHNGSAVFGLKKNGERVLVIGDSLQPRLVCVSR